MKIGEIVEQLGLEVLSCRDALDREATGVYVSDLLSDVMANGKEGNIWITLQTHMNIVAVAGMKDLSCVIIVSGRRPPEDVIARAGSEGVMIALSNLSAFELAGRLYIMFSPGG
jgi:hypothetical protein